MFFINFKKLLLTTLFFALPFNTSSAFASELLKSNNQVLLAEAKNYREHEDNSENDEDFHSVNHDWENHYHTISSIKLKSNGNLKIKFCEKVEFLEGQVYAGDVKYDVKDAFKIRKKSITWRLKKKGTFNKGDTIFVNTKDFLGRPIEDDPNYNEIRSLNRGCGLPFLYLPPGVEVKDNGGGAIGILGLVIAVGVAAGGGGSGSSSSN